MDEIGLINEYIQKEAAGNANIIMGVGQDLELGDNISVTVVATGFPAEEQIYTGVEDEKVIHRLEDDQPIVKKLSPETPFPVNVKKDVTETPKNDQNAQNQEEVEVRYVLEEEEEIETKVEETPDDEFILQTRETPSENELKFEFEEEKEEEEIVSQPMMFTLDDLDEIEDVQHSPMNTHSLKVKNQRQEQDEIVNITTQ